MALPDPATLFGIYIHWPFCEAKCPYCDFNSHVREGIDQARWRAGLLRELETLSERVGTGRPVTSVFFGGGTPSLMAPETAADLLAAISALFDTSEALEVTLEANPTSVELEKLAQFKAAGVNRVSLGVQALDGETLKFLGRTHSADQAIQALEAAQTLFERASFDLIYARPGQSASAWQAELDRALSFGTSHFSLYQLTIEPGTVFWRLREAGRLTELEEDTAADLYELTRERCRAAGLERYEISNFARPGQECLHNLTYWTYAPYLGIGPGAHGRLPLGAGEGEADQGRLATVGERGPERWLDLVERHGHGLVEETAIEPRQAAEEYLLMALRLEAGADLDRYHRLGGGPLEETRLAACRAFGLLQSEKEAPPTRLIATDRGRLLLDRLTGELLA